MMELSSNSIELNMKKDFTGKIKIKSKDPSQRYLKIIAIIIAITTRLATE